MARPAGDLVVAIDGPSGSGKSTVAREVARRLRLRYLDTGGMYRALTWLALQLGTDLADPQALAGLAEESELDISMDPDAPTVRIGGRDVTAAIRGPEVTAAVSQVSAVPAVRAAMVRRQRAAAASGGIVVEGRDIGTTVLPDAPVKVFLTADAAARARRRGMEMAGPEPDQATLAATAEALRRRDSADSHRVASPLAQAPDAYLIDSTDLSVDEVVARILARAEAPA